jgi:FkbM family methyltransferase
MKLKYTNTEHKVLFESIIQRVDQHQNANPSRLHGTTQAESPVQVVPNSPMVHSNELYQLIESSNNNINRINQLVGNLLKTADNPAYRPLTTKTNLFQRFSLFLKKSVRKSLKWYIEPIANQQTLFNQTVTPAVGVLNENNATLLRQMIIINQELKVVADSLLSLTSSVANLDNSHTKIATSSHTLISNIKVLEEHIALLNQKDDELNRQFEFELVEVNRQMSTIQQAMTQITSRFESEKMDEKARTNHLQSQIDLLLHRVDALEKNNLDKDRQIEILEQKIVGQIQEKDSDLASQFETHRLTMDDFLKKATESLQNPLESHTEQINDLENQIALTTNSLKDYIAVSKENTNQLRSEIKIHTDVLQSVFENQMAQINNRFEQFGRDFSDAILQERIRLEQRVQISEEAYRNFVLELTNEFNRRINQIEAFQSTSFREMESLVNMNETSLRQVMNQLRDDFVNASKMLEKQESETKKLHSNDEIQDRLIRHQAIALTKMSVVVDTHANVIIPKLLADQTEITQLVSAQYDNLTEEHLIRNNPYSSIYRSYSQSGEDTIIEYVLRLSGIAMNQVKYLDIGANHPIILNNTYALYKRGARGVLVEANPSLCKNLFEVRPNDQILNKAIYTKDDETIAFYVSNYDGLSSVDAAKIRELSAIDSSIKIIAKIEVTTITITSLVNQFFNGQSPTVVSIDIEGLEMELLRGFDFNQYRPKIIVVEMIDFGSSFAKESNQEIRDFMKANQYFEYAFTGINSIFVNDWKTLRKEEKDENSR